MLQHLYCTLGLKFFSFLFLCKNRIILFTNHSNQNLTYLELKKAYFQDTVPREEKNKRPDWPVYDPLVSAHFSMGAIPWGHPRTDRSTTGKDRLEDLNILISTLAQILALTLINNMFVLEILNSTPFWLKIHRYFWPK